MFSISLYHLLYQSFIGFPTVISGNWLSILLPLAVVIIKWAVEWRKGRREAMRPPHLKRDFWIMAAVYIALFMWSVVRTVYQDHQSERATNSSLRSENADLKTKSPYEKSFMGSFAYLNSVQAFGYLVRDPRHQPDADSDCQLKITTVPENRAIAQSLHNIATSIGCYVQPEPFNPDLNPQSSKEISMSPSDFITIHSQRENARAEGFVTGMTNSFHVQRAYDLPDGSPNNLVWLQIGPGSIWRVGQ
jgi:hypothetical protein